jgi:hypothetical protein
MTVTRYFVAAVTIIVTGLMLIEAPGVLASQIGDIEGVITPWGTELERYTLSVPLFVSTFLVFLNACLDVVKAIGGVPEELQSHSLDPEG